MKPKIHFSAPVPAGDLTKAVQPARLQHLGSNYYLQTKKGLQFLSPHSFTYIHDSLQMMPVNILVWSRSHCSQEHRGQLSLGAAYILCQCAKHKGLMQKRPSITIEVQFRVIYTHTFTALGKRHADFVITTLYVVTGQLYLVTFRILGYFSFLEV